MIIYASKKTFERYKLKLPSELSDLNRLIAEEVIANESGDKIFEWGAKIFYFDRRKCIQLVNLASKFTLFLIDVKVSDKEMIGDMIVHYLFELYKDDREMIDAMDKMFKESRIACFQKLTDKSAIATLNTTQTGFALDGYRFYDFIRNGVLYSMEINYLVNFDWLFTMTIDGKKEYIYSGVKFREVVLERYGR